MNNIEKNNIHIVSIIIPCRNEKNFIGICLDSVICQDYPKKNMEVLVIDGMSEDGTREIVRDYIHKYSYIKLVDNPKKITPIAFNTGIKNAKGEVIVIIGAHSTYEKNYISKCVNYLYKYEVDNVGGTMVTLPRVNNLIGRSIANVLMSRFGVGNSDFRTGTKEPKYTDTVFGGCYRKEIFEKIGCFNEYLQSSQDMEFNRRLKKAGGKILLVPDIVSYYYTRSDFISFCKNNFRNGVWAVYPLKFTDNLPVSIRHLIPLVFVLSLLGSALLSFLIPVFLWLFLCIVISYFTTNIYFSSKIFLKEKDLRYLIIEPFIFTSLHVFYGLGSIWGGFKLLMPPKG